MSKSKKSKKATKKSLSPGEIHDAYHAAIRQADLLIKEARVLLQHGHSAGAMNRLVIALEELGKNRLLFYQGALTVDNPAGDWVRFWKSYYSHTDKLDIILVWNDGLAGPDASTTTGVAGAVQRLRERAVELDRQKQSSAYSDQIDGTFQFAGDVGFEEDAKQLLALAEQLLTEVQKHHATRAPKGSFAQALRKINQYIAASRFSPGPGEDMYTVIAEGNAPLFLLRDEDPTWEQFIARVAERYAVIPPLLSVTLPILRAAPEFLEFYTRLRLKNGYPDWVILGTISTLP